MLQLNVLNQSFWFNNMNTVWHSNTYIPASLCERGLEHSEETNKLLFINLKEEILLLRFSRNFHTFFIINFAFAWGFVAYSTSLEDKSCNKVSYHNNTTKRFKIFQKIHQGTCYDGERLKIKYIRGKELMWFWQAEHWKNQFYTGNRLFCYLFKVVNSFMVYLGRRNACIWFSHVLLRIPTLRVACL